MNKILGKIFLLLLVLPAPDIDASELLIKNARLYTLSDDGIIENGYIVIKEGLITELGSQNKIGFSGKIIDAAGMSITPGLINSYTHLGLIEIDAVSQSNDVSTENELFGPAFEIASAINPASTAIPQNRINGLTHAIVAPLPGHQLFAGQGAAIRLQNAESLLISENVGLFADFAALGSKLSGGSRAAAYARIRQTFLDAREYEKNRDKIRAGDWREYFLPLHDLEALLPVINAKKPLIVTVHRASDIRLLLKLQKEFKLRLILVGASEARLVANELAAAGVAVIIDPMANLPLDFDQLAARLDSAARLHAAGVKLLFTGIAWRNTHSAYQVRQAAGNAVTYGLPEIEAMKAMSLNPAQAFGFDDRFGSIEIGKVADLVIWDGHPLELLTQADKVIMAGEEIAMVSRATRLRERYRQQESSYPPAYRK